MRAVAVAQVTGTHAGTIMGLPPSGRSFRFDVALVFVLEDGCISRERRIYDFTGFLVQIGVLKAKPA
jgi:predicted ester cyclase